MTSLGIAFLFLVGLCVGSFLNVVVYRLNHRLSPFKGRSICPRCRKKIAWHDNLPLFSFLWLRGRCRHCHSPISWQYPLVELTTGILFVWVYWWTANQCGGWLECLLVALFHCYLVAVLISLFVSDWRYMTLPDQIVYPAIVVALLYAIGKMQYAVIAAVLSSAFFWLLVLVTRGKGMGWGDVKLAGLMGLVLSWPNIIIALYLAFLTGAIAGVILILLGQKKFGQHIPFGPFLAASTFISLFWGHVIWHQISAALALTTKMTGF